jgi:hypothetical protein
MAGIGGTSSGGVRLCDVAILFDLRLNLAEGRSSPLLLGVPSTCASGSEKIANAFLDSEMLLPRKLLYRETFGRGGRTSVSVAMLLGKF